MPCRRFDAAAADIDAPLATLIFFAAIGYAATAIAAAFRYAAAADAAMLMLLPLSADTITLPTLTLDTPLLIRHDAYAFAATMLPCCRYGFSLIAPPHTPLPPSPPDTLMPLIEYHAFYAILRRCMIRAMPC